MYPEKHRVSFRSFWYKIRDAIGLTTDDQMRDLRHHFATHLLNNDTDIATVSALMNHKSIKTTADHYAQVLGQTKQKALAKASKGLKLF
jgi:site-specific recombinase XerD